MAKTRQRPAAVALIKGYLPVRLKLPEAATIANQTETFFFVREHRHGVHKSGTATLFISNAPIVPGIKTRLLLKALLGRYGDVERVTLVENPRKLSEAATPYLTWGDNLRQFYPSFLGPISASEKFAHVVFSSQSQMKRALLALTEVMAEEEGEISVDKKFPGLQLEKLEWQVLKDETDRLQRQEIRSIGADDDSDDDDNNFNDSNQQQERRKETCIRSLAQRYRSSLQRLSRDKLLEQCNQAMQEYEDAEEAQRLAREAAANQPDDDGFITVTSTSVGVEASKAVLEKTDKGNSKRRRNAQKRSRKKKESIGATELQDFYRFQRKETRKRTLQDLRKQFEEDLQRVKKMKEDKQYKPF